MKENRATPFSLVGNPSTLADWQGGRWGVGVEKKIAIPGWTGLITVLTIDKQIGKWGVGLSQEGVARFNNQFCLLTHARNLGEDLSMGVSFGCQRQKATGYSAILTPVATLGMMLDLSTTWQAGFTVGNKIEKAGSSSWDGLKLAAGFCFRPSTRVDIRLQCLKESGYKASLQAAGNYCPSTQVKITFGVLEEPLWIWASLDFLFRTFSIKLQTSWHPYMGVSSSLFLYDPYRME